MAEDKGLLKQVDDDKVCRPLHAYDIGVTAASACQADQRFSYSLYVPAHFPTSNPEDFRLMVVVHGTNRPNQTMLLRFQEFADENNSIIVAPLFPARIDDPEDLDNYKYISYKGIRFDQVLLSMIDEISERYDIKRRPFSLFGFSGGAHFAHRFLILHPERLSAVSIAAPGSVTLVDRTSDWWVGVANLEQMFGKKVDLDAMQRVPVHLVVGENDTKTNEIIHSPGSRHWMAGANDAGANRIERLKTLADNLRDHGIATEHEILPGVGHQEGPLAQAAVRFFRQLR